MTAANQSFMKILSPVFCSIFALLMMASIPAAMAQEVPCLIFSGNAGNKSIAISDYNRISFGNDAMILSSSANPNKPALDLLYSDYNTFRVRNDAPSGVAEIKQLNNFGLVYYSASKEIGVSSACSEPINISIYNLAGMAIGSDVINPGERVSIANSPAGVYLVVATCGPLRNVCKIVKN